MKNLRYHFDTGGFNCEPDDVLLSLEIQPTIIGDKMFHCPVRNGKEWYHLSMVIRQRRFLNRGESLTFSATSSSTRNLCEVILAKLPRKSCRGEKPLVSFDTRGFQFVSLTMSYFHWKYNQLSSAIRCFTVLFGMGRSGATSLWSSGKGFVHEGRILYLVRNEARAVCFSTHEILFFDIQPKKLHGYRIKLHEQLVLVSLVPHSTYTPNLSTSWSRTTL